MNGLIQDLLDVARLEAGEPLPITQGATSASSLLAEAIEHQQGEISRSDRELIVGAAGESLSVWVDRTRLLQVLDNLLGNAIKFCRKRITVGARPKDGEVLFWVSNDGEGIPPDAIAHVFDRFWQATRGDRRGAGLGLSIVKGIIEAHGGKVWVESPPGVGTTFYFTVPTARTSPIEQRSSPV
jgi:signal transduction histidine kinase